MSLAVAAFLADVTKAIVVAVRLIWVGEIGAIVVAVTYSIGVCVMVAQWCVDTARIPSYLADTVDAGVSRANVTVTTPKGSAAPVLEAIVVDNAGVGVAVGQRHLEAALLDTGGNGTDVSVAAPSHRTVGAISVEGAAVVTVRIFCHDTYTVVTLVAGAHVAITSADGGAEPIIVAVTVFCTFRIIVGPSQAGAPHDEEDAQDKRPCWKSRHVTPPVR